uniref:Uncharacterized protein n=1 Tax=Tanacetum cinerariifolium TaxID=118510 RepID=A0A6L2MD52_TANCI|nr:hypothetical protein [Tanacetum cinerariifolium]
MDEGFTVTAYPNVHENLKLTVEEQMILKEPASSIGTMSSLQHLDKDFNFDDQFFNDKPYEAENKKTTAKIKAESMVSVTIHQDTSEIPPMTSPMIDLISRPDSPNGHRPLPATVTKAVYEIVTDAVDWAIQALLQNRFRDFPKAYMKEILHQRMWETNSYKAHEDHMMLAFGSSQLPPSPSSSTSQSDQSKSTAALSSSKTAASAEYTAGRLLTQDSSYRHKTQAVNLKQDWWKPLEEDRPATPEPAWSIPSSDLHVLMNNWAFALTSTYAPPPKNSLLAQTCPTFEIVKVFHPNVIHLQYPMKKCHKILPDKVDESIIMYNVSKPLPLGGLPGQVTIQSDFFNKALEYLRYGRTGCRPAFSISKMKAAYYPDVGLEQMVPDHMWIEEECKYDIAAMYGIFHWWFQRQRFYIDRHTSEGDRRAVRTHMRIISVVRIEVFSLHVYDYMKKIVLCRANLNEHIIVEKDFKYLYPSDFEDLDKYRVQMIMRFNEIHKFSNGTLHQIDEALDYRVKEFKVNRMNLGLNTRFWTRKDVDRSKEFMFAI